MPPRGGKKKQKGRRNTLAKGLGVQPSNNSRPSASAKTAPGSTKHPPSKEDPPNFEAFQNSGKVLPDKCSTEYFYYKPATYRIFEYLQILAPKTTKNQEEPFLLSSILDGADRMAQAKIPVDPNILNDLKYAIFVRAWVAPYLIGASSHKYVVDPLIYCWKVLKSLPRAAKKGNRSEGIQETDELDDEYDESVLSLFSSKDILRPILDPEEGLMYSEDRIDAWFFILTLNDFMQGIAEKSVGIFDVASKIAQGQLPGHEILPTIMSFGIQTNMVIQNVQKLEMEFESQNPHISTPYRLLATILVAELAREVVQITREHGSVVCSTSDASMLAGDCLECFFRHEKDPARRDGHIKRDFCRRFKVDSEGSESIDELIKDLFLSTLLEVPLTLEMLVFQSPSHMWLRGCKYIGGDRAIHHTLRLLQLFGFLAKPGQRVQVDLFGPSLWNPSKSNKIHNDLDFLLVSEILPCWLFMCRDGVLNKDEELPRQNEIAPLWSCLRRFVQSPEKPVKWSTLFSVHAILTGILETAKFSKCIASNCQKVFDLYFVQMDLACEHNAGVVGSSDSPLVQNGLSVLRHFKKLWDPRFSAHALWNPLCAGTVLAYLNYQGNMTVGTALIDNRSQLKIVLHLHHALLVNGILQPEDIPFLDGLYNGFQKSESLWGGSLPPKKRNVCGVVLVEHELKIQWFREDPGEDVTLR